MFDIKPSLAALAAAALLAAGPAAWAQNKPKPPARPAQAAERVPAQLHERLLYELSKCDATVFETMAKNFAALNAHGELAMQREWAYFKVKDRRGAADARVLFKAPLKVANNKLDVVGYFDEDSGAPEDATFSWGFLVKTDVAEAAKLLRPLIWESRRVRIDGELVVRTELWDPAKPDDGFTKLLKAPESTEPGTVERHLVIETAADPSLVRFGCSLRGKVPLQMRRELRPDLG
jgi:hypothetical protein